MQFSLIHLLHSVPHINGKKNQENPDFPPKSFSHWRETETRKSLLSSTPVTVSPVFSVHMVNSTFNPNSSVYVEVSLQRASSDSSQTDKKIFLSHITGSLKFRLGKVEEERKNSKIFNF